MNKLELFDTHCHLDMLEGDLDAMVKDAKANGVARMQTICVTLEGLERIFEIASQYENVTASVGVHPNHVLKQEDIPSVEQLIALSDSCKVTALGETGLDYFRPEGDKRHQKTAFANHIYAAQRNGLPVIVHTRDAAQDTLEMLESHAKEKPFKAIIHCFTQDRAFAYRVIDLGFWISFSGIVTFKNAQEIQFCAANIPMESILIETDAPYLAPSPLRGKPNQPAYILHTAQFLAHLRGMSLVDFGQKTTQNALKAIRI